MRGVDPKLAELGRAGYREALQHAWGARIDEEAMIRSAKRAMNRPERLNALGRELRTALAEAGRDFRDRDDLDVAIFTGTGRGFCAGEDMKESVERGGPDTGRDTIDDPFMRGALQKPVIAAINGFAMGGGFLRVAVRAAVFEISEAKRWLLGDYDHGFVAGLPHPIATRWRWDSGARPSAAISSASSTRASRPRCSVSPPRSTSTAPRAT